MPCRGECERLRLPCCSPWAEAWAGRTPPPVAVALLVVDEAPGWAFPGLWSHSSSLCSGSRSPPFQLALLGVTLTPLPVCPLAQEMRPGSAVGFP